MLGPRRAQRYLRRKNIAVTRTLYKWSKRFPKLMRRLLIAQVRAQLPEHVNVDDGVWQRRALADQTEFLNRVLR
ncbi:hypothetical protein [Actinopolyspora mortivallis]|uniref:hypothetical protein n=1 Tax=Actinopolyspora mortivallis TaxID=33906 RepID=UPI00036BB262|nr:hypothetical protein [Actinopolyspora mortivallis]